MTSPYLAGSNFTAASANLLAGVNLKMKSVDNSLPNNTTTLTNDGELILPVLANKKYGLVGCLIYDSSTTADFNAFFTTPSGSTLRWTLMGFDLTATTGQSAGTIVLFMGTTVAVGGVGVGTTRIAVPIGSVVTGANAGNVQLQFAQNISDASPTTLHAGSWIGLLLSS